MKAIRNPGLGCFLLSRKLTKTENWQNGGPLLCQLYFSKHFRFFLKLPSSFYGHLLGASCSNFSPWLMPYNVDVRHSSEPSFVFEYNIEFCSQKVSQYLVCACTR